LHGLAERARVNFLFDTRAIKLLTDDMGRITGVKVKTSDYAKDLKAKAVVLTTGSYEGNQEMMIKYVGPDITYGTVITGCQTNTGDGHLMALEIGAQLINGSVCHIRTTDRFYGPGPTRHLHNIYHFGIFINRDCNRFIDECTADSDMIANAIAFQPGQVATLIFDEKARNIYPREYETYPRKEDIIQKVHTIQEMAEVIEVSPSRLRKLIEEFNASIKDDKALGLNIPKTSRALPIDTPPFYCFHPVVPGLNHPLGGLKINTKAQVLDRENNPIPGLYAAGSIVNWAFGRSFLVGDVISYKGSYHAGKSSGLATALVFGRAAGRSAAAEIPVDSV
jgi:succinate dehydrogenase/fumarate reductase flavoprotein subunit